MASGNYLIAFSTETCGKQEWAIKTASWKHTTEKQQQQCVFNNYNKKDNNNSIKDKQT